MSTQRRSMTGYGAGTAETADYRVVVEMKAVNQRFLEIAPHMPRAFGAWEGDLRELIRTRVARGKLDVYVSFEDRSEKRYAVHVNEGIARAYYAALGRVAHAVDAPLSDGMRMTAAYEGVITISEDADLSGARTVFLDAAARALDALDVMRLAEGAHIVRDFEKRLARLEEQREEVKRHAPQIVADYRAHLTEVLAEFRTVTPDETRIMQEAALYYEKACRLGDWARLGTTDEKVGDIVNHLCEASESLKSFRPKESVAQRLLRDAARP